MINYTYQLKAVDKAILSIDGLGDKIQSSSWLLKKL
jgi:hypothetical protein